MRCTGAAFQAAFGVIRRSSDGKAGDSEKSENPCGDRGFGVKRRHLAIGGKMEAAGIEPASDCDLNGKLDCGCVICEECRAAMALHPYGLDWLDLALSDGDLQSVIRAWKCLREPLRKAIRALLGSQGL